MAEPELTTPARSLACERCGADVGEPCVSRSGSPTPREHVSRLKAVRTAGLFSLGDAKVSSPPGWLTTRQAATLLGVSVRTVLDVCRDQRRCEKEWGRDADGQPRWRERPLTIRRIFEVRADAVEERLYG